MLFEGFLSKKGMNFELQLKKTTMKNKKNLNLLILILLFNISTVIAQSQRNGMNNV